jgi:hypothetical protein
MATVVLHPAALRAQLAALAPQAERAGEAPVVAFRGEVAWEGGEAIEVDRRVWAVRQCASSLEVREALAFRDPADGPLVILTPLSHVDLGADVTARFLKRRLLELDTWEPVLRAFGAQRLDARLAAQKWLSEVLLQAMPPAGYPPVASGTLDAATAARFAMQALTGVDAAAAADLAGVLEWTLDPAFGNRWRSLGDEQRAPLGRWVVSVAGTAAGVVLAWTAEGHGADALPLALACETIFDEPMPAAGGRAEAVIRLERFTGGERLAAPAGRALASAAAALVATLAGADDARMAGVLARADALLETLGAAGEAWRSRWSPRGYGQRLDRFAEALRSALDETSGTGALARATALLGEVGAHARTRDEPDRLARATQALRLVRYLRATRDDPAPGSFRDAATAYLATHAFADLARAALYGSEPHPALGETMTLVAERALVRRESFTAAFAELARHWFEAPSDGPGIVPIERLLHAVVAPLARRRPVLLVVVDGMSGPVAEMLVPSILRRGWMPVESPALPAGTAVVAALPSVTEVCRTSLFCGALRIGAAADEHAGLASHPELEAVSKPKHAPRLFHKGELGAAAALAPDLADAIAKPEQRVVGVVVNAVDDHLLKDDMVRPAWSTEYVPILAALCDAARAAGRAIVLTSDHGHVLDLKLTDKVTGSESDRYRPVRGSMATGEVLVSGPRVLAPGGAVVVAASERIRYASRKNGYHGGMSPQELVVPLVVLCPDGDVPEGYAEAPRPRPAWWTIEAPLGGAAPAAAPPVRRKPELPLFEPPEVEHVPGAAGAGSLGAMPEPAWIGALLASTAFAVQRARGARAALPDERLRVLLATLASRGGRMTVQGVAERLGMPPGRVSPIVSAAGQLLNFDGYQSLFLDGGDVVLDEALLIAQFQLEAPRRSPGGRS